MSLAIVYTRASLGIDAPIVEIEVHISNGLPAFTLVGLPETTVKEARDRVRSAITNSGFSFPAKRITVSLAPANLPKEGARFDLPIAIAILAASAQVSSDNLRNYEFLGELSLSGELRRIDNIISALIAMKHETRQLIIPQKNEYEASLVSTSPPLLANNLLIVCHQLNQQLDLPIAKGVIDYISQDSEDLQDIIGQTQAKRALEIAAAGGHHLLLIGPPGTGKTMLANRLRALLPPLTEEEALETAAITTLVESEINRNWQQRPFRAPHHSLSIAALIGGGSIPKPGEISLAHNGILFLDELPEFNRAVLDALRQPLETGKVIISRAKAKVTYPAKCQLISAMNPTLDKTCLTISNSQQAYQALKYLRRLSGPFLDRFDLSIDVPMLPDGMISQYTTQQKTETSQQIRERVNIARQCQLARNGKVNSELAPNDIEIVCKLTTTDAYFLEKTLKQLGLSIRAWHKILRVSRTIADLEGISQINKKHLIEALNYRCIDRLFYQINQIIYQ